MKENLLEVTKAAELDRLGFQALHEESSLHSLKSFCEAGAEGQALPAVVALNNIIHCFPLPQVTSPTPTTTTPLAGETLLPGWGVANLED